MGIGDVILEALQNKDKRAKIAVKIRKYADVLDEVVRMSNENLKEIK